MNTPNFSDCMQKKLLTYFDHFTLPFFLPNPPNNFLSNTHKRLVWIAFFFFSSPCRGYPQVNLRSVEEQDLRRGESMHLLWNVHRHWIRGIPTCFYLPFAVVTFFSVPPHCHLSPFILATIIPATHIFYPFIASISTNSFTFHSLLVYLKKSNFLCFFVFLLQ